MTEEISLRFGEPYWLNLDGTEHFAGLYGKLRKNFGSYEFCYHFIIRDSGELFNIEIDETNISVVGSRICPKDSKLVKRIRCNPNTIGHSHVVDAIKSAERNYEHRKRK